MEKAICNKINFFSPAIYSLNIWKDSKASISIFTLTGEETVIEK